MAHAERDANRGRDLEELNVRPRGSASESSPARESQAANFETISDSHKKRTDKRESAGSSLEDRPRDRLKELDDREGELDLREAQLEADGQIRGDKLEEREEALAELEERLANQERELAALRREGADRDPAPRVRVVAEAARKRRGLGRLNPLESRRAQARRSSHSGRLAGLARRRY